MRLVKKIGIFNADGEIVLHQAISISWKSLSKKIVPGLPQGTPLVIDISIDEQNLISGQYGIVWASYDQRQAEVLHNALLAQSITSAIGKIELDDGLLMMIIIDNLSDADEAMDFIWRKDSGLRLKPDWTYPDGEPNKSFEKWLNG